MRNLTRSTAAALLAGLFCASPALTPGALAQGAAGGAPADPCDVFSGYELGNCLTKELDGARKALDAAYKRAVAAIGADADSTADQKTKWRADLLAAQEAWVAFRDANCKFDLIGAEWSFGSGTTAAQQQCLLTLTKTRTRELLDRYPQS